MVKLQLRLLLVAEEARADILVMAEKANLNPSQAAQAVVAVAARLYGVQHSGAVAVAA
jgi:adenine deaminase